MSKKIKLTKKQIKEYLKDGGVGCPRCKSRDINAEQPDLDGPVGTQNVTCSECGLIWTDLLRLEGIDKDNVFSS